MDRWPDATSGHEGHPATSPGLDFIRTDHRMPPEPAGRSRPVASFIPSSMITYRMSLPCETSHGRPMLSEHPAASPISAHCPPPVSYPALTMTPRPHRSSSPELFPVRCPWLRKDDNRDTYCSTALHTAPHSVRLTRRLKRVRKELASGGPDPGAGIRPCTEGS